jgi:nucleotide-binding universal stress UspA family protein
MSNRIVIGYDLEQGGEDALQLGRWMSQLLDAEPLVVVALPWPSYMGGIENLQAHIDVEVDSRFTKIRDELRDLGVETRAIASPSAALAIEEVAVKEKASMIVLGSSHRGAIGRTLAGSVGESLMHGAPCAVAIAPRGYATRKDSPDHEARIGVAFDGSSEARRALEAGADLARRADAGLTVVAVAAYPHYGYSAAWSVMTAGELRTAEQEDKRRLLAEVAADPPSGLDVETRLLAGDPGRALADVSYEFDLLVTGSRAYGPVRRTLLGSTSRRLIRSADCPVLVAPRGVPADFLGLRPARGSRVAAPT